METNAGIGYQIPHLNSIRKTQALLLILGNFAAYSLLAYLLKFQFNLYQRLV